MAGSSAKKSMAEAQAEVMKAAASTAAAVGFGGRCRRTMTSVVGSAVKLLWQEEWQKDWQRPDGPAGIAGFETRFRRAI